MHSQDGLVTIVFNGEIYNHRDVRSDLEARGNVFGSRSDTEVLLAAYQEWGVSCVERLDGMFAFAIFDSERRVMFLARDRAGEKPLFIHQSGKALRFASELKALLADDSLPRHADPESLSCLLGLGYVPGGHCILSGFEKLPAAHAMLFDLVRNTARRWRYWHPPSFEASISAPQPQAEPLADELESLLGSAVERQLIADVPVGVLLSGGLDSSIITAIAARYQTQLKTFTVTFGENERVNEATHARLVANHFSTDHHELDAGPGFSADLLPLLAAQFDEPIVDSSMLPTFLVSRLVRTQCHVALGGDGGDELFGGYTRYGRLLRLAKLSSSVPLAARRFVARLAETALPVGAKGRKWLIDAGTDFSSQLPPSPGPFDAISREGLGLIARDTADRIFASRIVRDDDLIQRATRTDFENYLVDDILVKVDRASMLNSLEVRAPLLDRQVMEFAFGRVPSSLKTTHGARKLILRALAARILPKEFDTRRKQGFAIPLREWLREGPIREYFLSVLHDRDSVVPRTVATSLFRGLDNGRPNAERLFALVMLELWRRAYRISI